MNVFVPKTYRPRWKRPYKAKELEAIPFTGADSGTLQIFKLIEDMLEHRIEMPKHIHDANERTWARTHAERDRTIAKLGLGATIKEG